MADLLSSDVPIGPSASTTQTLLPDWYTNYAMQVLSNQQAASAQPYAAYQAPRVAGFTPDQQAGFDQTRVAATSWRPGLNIANQAAKGTLDMSAFGAAQPSLQTGAGYLQQSTTPTGINMAQPYLSQAGQTSVADIGSYMDPYQDAVVNRIGALGLRNLQENLLPAIGDQFVGAGGYGGSRQAEAIGRAVRDTQEGISAQQAQALSSGYQGALQASQTDLARQAQLAGTAGNLGVAQQGALQAAGTGMAGIGGQLGALTTADIQSKLDASRQIASIADQRQRQLLTGAGALQGVGQQQQALQQQNLDVAYQDFLRQQGYDQTQIDAMAKTIGAVQPAVPKSVLETGYAPATAQQEDSSPSWAQTAANLAGAWLLG